MMSWFREKMAEAPLIPVTVRERAFAPHCDQRVLHAPKHCQYCDQYPDWQELRRLWGINFTGENVAGKIRCPSEELRSLETINRWPGNQPSLGDREILAHEVNRETT